MNPAHSASQRVLFCITELDIGGAEKALTRIACGLSKHGWNVSVVSLRDLGPLAEVLQQQRIPVQALGCGGFGDVRAIWRLRRYLRQQPPEVLVSFLHQANIVSRLAGRLAGVSPIVSGIRVADRRWWIRWTERLTQRWVDHYVAVSPTVAEVHGQLCHIDSSRLSSIPNGVDLPVAAAQSAKQSELRRSAGYRILFVGRLTAQKAPQLLLDAYCRLPAELQAETVLDYIGAGPLRAELEHTIQAAGISDRVHLLGHRDDVSRQLMSADLLVLPSRWEGLPNVVLEAMAHGVPVVASDVDGIRDLIRHEHTGWLIPVGDSHTLTQTLNAVLRAPEQRDRVAERARAHVQQEFSWDNAIRRYDQLLRSLTKT